MSNCQASFSLNYSHHSWWEGSCTKWVIFWVDILWFEAWNSWAWENLFFLDFNSCSTTIKETLYEFCGLRNNVRMQIFQGCCPVPLCVVAARSGALCRQNLSGCAQWGKKNVKRSHKLVFIKSVPRSEILKTFSNASLLFNWRFSQIFLNFSWIYNW